jgi:hypothetical protein
MLLRGQNHLIVGSRPGGRPTPDSPTYNTSFAPTLGRAGGGETAVGKHAGATHASYTIRLRLSVFRPTPLGGEGLGVRCVCIGCRRNAIHSLTPAPRPRGAGGGNEVCVYWLQAQCNPFLSAPHTRGARGTRHTQPDRVSKAIRDGGKQGPNVMEGKARPTSGWPDRW